MAVTNLTNLTDAGGNAFKLLDFVNDSTGGVFAMMFVFTIFFILLMMFLRQYSFEESLLGSSFLIFGICIFLRVMELIPFSILLTFGIITGVSMIWVYLAKK